MATASPPAGNSPVTPVVRWLILILASIGFAFDIYELLMLPLVGPDALPDMGYPRGSPGFVNWVLLLFYVPAIFGGIFGLMGGYLTDLFGRRAVLTYSILLYAVSAFLAGFSTSPGMLLVFRCGVFVGVCVEFVAAVAWLAELFPIPKEREKALGYTQAFSSIGGLLVAVAYGICINYGQNFPVISMPNFLVPVLGDIPETQQHAAWRYTLMSGLIPAIPLLIIRPFLPESPVWQQKKQAGLLKRPSIKELFTTPKLRTTTIVTTIMFACSYGAAFGAIQQMRNIIPDLEFTQEKAQKLIDRLVVVNEDGKSAKVKDGLDQNNVARKILEPLIYKDKVEQPGVSATDPPISGKTLNEKQFKIMKKIVHKGTSGKVNAEYTKIQELGGLTGRFLLALLVLRIASRRNLLRVFQIPGLILTPLVFWFFLTMPNPVFFEINLEFLYLGTLPIMPVSIGMFLVGLFTVAQFSFWGNYLPRVYPLHLRGTGESFAANVGGRLVGTSFAAVTLGISMLIPAEDPANPGKDFAERMAMAAAGVGFFVYFVGTITCFFLPEPKGEELENEDPPVDMEPG